MSEGYLELPERAPHGMSAKIEKIAAALSKAQGEIRNALKDSENPHFKSQYADLASVWDACRGPLSKNGLSVTQTTGLIQVSREKSLMMLTTVLMHESGQWISSGYPVEPQQQTPQGFGSALTYSRRYSLASLVGVAPDEDDDGNMGSGKKPAPASKPTPQGNVPQSKPEQKKEPWKMSEAQGKRLFAISNEAKWSPEQVKAYMFLVFKVETSAALTYDQYQRLCLLLSKKPNFEEEMKSATPSAQPKPETPPPQEFPPDDFENRPETEEERKF